MLERRVRDRCASPTENQSCHARERFTAHQMARPSAAIIDMLNREVSAGLADPKIKAKFADLGATVLTLSPADFGKLIAEDTEKWGKVIRAANIKPE